MHATERGAPAEDTIGAQHNRLLPPPGHHTPNTMTSPPSYQSRLDVVVVGGGVAGLWTLDALIQAGHNAVLIESTALGNGQTVCAQGILHGGVKYSIASVLHSGPQFVREMPARWEASLNGTQQPDLSDVSVRTQACYLWRTESLKSIAGMVGAKVALQVRPETLAPEDRPEVLRNCPGDVALLPEYVIETPSLLNALAAPHAGRIIQGTILKGTVNDLDPTWLLVELPNKRTAMLHPKKIVIAAGSGTPQLLSMLNVQTNPKTLFEMHTRPLHMAMVMGPSNHLPELNGHCVDGSKTRVTITSSTAANGHRVWQLGGELAEQGCHESPEQLCQSARTCLEHVLPGFDASNPELAWATYPIDRAEHKTTSRASFDAFAAQHEDIIVTWPTKLVLAPRAAERITTLCGPGSGAGEPPFADVPLPPIAQPPWERATWT